MVKLGCWGEHAVQLHRFFSWDDIKVDFGVPFSVKADECELGETALKAHTKISEADVSASAQSSNSILLNWSEVPGATGYYLYRSTKAKKGYSALNPDMPVQQLSWTDEEGLSTNVTYYYKIQAVDADGNVGDYSEVSFAKTLDEVTRINPTIDEIKVYVKEYLEEKGCYTADMFRLCMATAQTESQFAQFDGNGDPKLNYNSDGTYDVGIMQINSSNAGDCLDSLKTDWKFNVRWGVGSLINACKERNVKNEALYANSKGISEAACIARAAYGRYNAGSSGYNRWRTSTDIRDTNFWKYYQEQYWGSETSSDSIQSNNPEIIGQPVVVLGEEQKGVEGDVYYVYVGTPKDVQHIAICYLEDGEWKNANEFTAGTFGCKRSEKKWYVGVGDSERIPSWRS